jgi:hypothetical protein
VNVGGTREWGLALRRDIREYRKLEACDAYRVETWDRICKPYGWPQKFVEELVERGVCRSKRWVLTGTGQSSMKGERKCRGLREACRVDVP